MIGAGLTLRQSSTGASRERRQASIRPSPSKSAKALPRWAFTGQAGFARDVAKLTVPGIGEDAVGLLVDGRFEHLHAIVDVRVGGEEVFPAIVVEIEQADVPNRCGAWSGGPRRDCIRCIGEIRLCRDCETAERFRRRAR